VGFLFYQTNNPEALELFAGNATLKRIADLIIGAVLGATMAHFLIDAGAWKLSKPLQRMYIGKRFAFMFAKPNHRLHSSV